MCSLARFRTTRRRGGGGGDLVRPTVVVLFVYQAEIHDGASCPNFTFLSGSVGLFGLTLEPVILDLFCTCDLFGVVKTFQVIFFGSDTVRGGVGLNVALLEFLPKGETARSASFEAESGLWRGASTADRV